MKKILLIGFKDLTQAFRDRAALLLMLLAPFLLTVGLGFVTGRLSGSSGASGLSDIPVVLVNQDSAPSGAQAALGETLVELFASNELADLIEPVEASDLAAARKLVDEDKAAAVVYIPQDFTRSIIPETGSLALPEPVQGAALRIVIYANPTRPTSVGVVQTILEQFLSRVEAGRVAGQVAVTQLISSGRIQPGQAQAVGQGIGERQADAGDVAVIRLNRISAGEAPVEFDVLAYMAPGMALMFLMYTVSYGGRSILTERAQGTLPRLLVSPTTSAQVLGGKVLGIYLTGVAQLAILILASSLLFNLKWGSPLGVTLLVLAAVFGATGWGMLLTAVARSPGQVASLGSALMLSFGILGGSFISLNNLPAPVQWISRLTPNAWGLDGFTALALGGGLEQVVTPVLALLAMGAVLFILASLLFNRHAVLER
jgi:ABC-2 type transport system permease protein